MSGISGSENFDASTSHVLYRPQSDANPLDITLLPEREIVVISDYHLPPQAASPIVEESSEEVPRPDSLRADPEEPRESFFVMPSITCSLSKGQVGLIAAVMAIVVIAAVIVGLYFGNANGHDFLTHKITVANTLLYAGVPLVGLALVFGLAFYVYRKHQKRLSDDVTAAMRDNNTIGDSPVYVKKPISLKSRQEQRLELEAAQKKQGLAEWGKTLKGLVPTPKQLGITAIVLLVLAGLGVGGYFLCTHVPAVEHWVTNDLIPAFNHQIQVWEAIAYTGAIVVGAPLVGIPLKKLVPSIFRKMKTAFERWENARNRCPYTDPVLDDSFSD